MQRKRRQIPARHAESGTSLGVSCRDVGMSWPLKAAARASVGLSRGSADTLIERAAGAGAGAGVGAGVACSGALAAAAEMSTILSSHSRNQCRSSSLDG